MRKDKRKIHWIWLALPISLILALAVFSIFMFFICVTAYPESDVSYSDFMYEELTFDSYKKYKVSRGRFTNNTIYEIKFEEYEKPFVVNDIAERRLDKVSLEKLESGESLKVYYDHTQYRYYEHEICVISSDSVTLLSLYDYIEAQNNNLILGMIVWPVFLLLCLYVLWSFVRNVRKYVPAKKRYKTTSGNIKVDYTINGDIIRVYKSVKGYSLVINEKIVDRCFDDSANNFSLYGKVRFYGNDIPVEAVIGRFNIHLYCDGKLVSKKFKWLG